jgi:hypothetical protein
VKDNGAEVQQTVHTWKPEMLIGKLKSTNYKKRYIA